MQWGGGDLPPAGPIPQKALSVGRIMAEPQRSNHAEIIRVSSTEFADALKKIFVRVVLNEDPRRKRSAECMGSEVFSLRPCPAGGLGMGTKSAQLVHPSEPCCGSLLGFTYECPDLVQLPKFEA